MKRLFYLPFVVLLFAGSASAQISYGLKAGVNIFNVKGEDFDDDDKKSHVGIAIGGLVNIKVQEKFSVQPELVFSQEGVLWKDGDYKEKESLTYLNIPVLAQYDDPSGFFAHTGPQVGFLLSAKEKYEEGGESETTDLKDEYKGAVFSWAIGAGFRHVSGLGIAARYNLGLSTIVKDDDDVAKGRGFNISLFYILGKAK